MSFYLWMVIFLVRVEFSSHFFYTGKQKKGSLKEQLWEGREVQEYVAGKYEKNVVNFFNKCIGYTLKYLWTAYFWWLIF